MDPRTDTWDVVVIGGGFAGIATARGLANKNVRVTIVDKHNFHTFLPLLYQVATAMLEPAEVAYPIRTIFGKAKNVGFRHAKVREVDHARSRVVLEDGSEIAFDHLVVATGATAAFFGIPGASQFAMPLYSLADARKLRNRLLISLEEADASAETSPISLNFVIVGGGPTGVETSGALSELIRTVIKRDGLRIDPSRVRVMLVDMAPRLLPPFPEKASEYALKELGKMGVDVEFGRSVVEVVKIGESQPEPFRKGGPAPRSGIRVLDLTRILAGPVDDPATAERICGELRKRSVGCILVRP